MRIFNKFIWSKTEPKNKNDVWFDGSVFNLYRNDTWEAFTLPVDAAEKVAEVIKNALNVFQSKLTAGKGISIKDDVISTTSLFRVVNILPEIGEEDVIYLVYTESSDIENKLVEYIWVENHFEKLGEFKADVDLSEYAKKEDIHTPNWNVGSGEKGFIKNRTHFFNSASTVSPMAWEINNTSSPKKAIVSLSKDFIYMFEYNNNTYYIKTDTDKDANKKLVDSGALYIYYKCVSGKHTIEIQHYSQDLTNTFLVIHQQSISSAISFGYLKQLDEIFIPDTIARKSEVGSGSPIKDSTATGSAIQTIEADTFTDKNEYSSTYGSEVDAEANGDYSLALGGDAAATAKRAVAQGHRCIARGETSHAEGHCAVVEYNDETYNGYGSHAEGYSTLVDGVYSHAEGSKTIAHGSNAHAEGGSTIVSSDFAHTEGYGTYTGDRNNAPQFESPDGGESGGNGDGIVAPDVEGKKGVAAHAEGNFTIAEGNYSHAEGRQSKSLGEAAHAEGNETTAEGNYSHSQGWVSHAIGGYSHAEGQNTRARGEASHSEGNNTDANGPHSHAEGVGTQTHSEVMGQHVEGHWNHITDGVMIVGCGTSNDDRKNAVEVKQGGRVFVKGIGGYEGTDIDGKKDLATVLGEIDTKIADTIVNVINGEY